MTSDPYAARWQPLTLPGQIVVGLFVVAGLGSIAGIVHLASAPPATDITVPDSELTAELQRALGAGSASVQALSWIVSLALGVMWLVWQHRAQGDLFARRLPDIRYTPGWSVGWWFVPGANLVLPYLCMRELFGRAGAPVEDPAVRRDWRLGAWWATYLGSIALGVIGGASAMAAATSRPQLDPIDPGQTAWVTVSAEAIRAARAWVIAGRVSAIVASGLAIWLVWTISRREDAAFVAMQASHGLSMPVPPRPDLS